MAARSAEFGLLAVAFLVPLAVNPNGVVAFEPLKASLVRTIAAFVALAWLVYRLWGSPAQRVAVLRQPIVRAAVLFAAASALACVASVNLATSLLGSLDRGMGVLTLLGGVALLVVAADLWTDQRRRERAITALLLGALLPCAYTLVQRLGRDPIPWSTLGAPGSTLGSPTFLGGYLVLLVPLALYRVVSSGREALRVGGRANVRYAAWLALLLILGATIAQTTIRGSLLALAAGALTFVVLLGRPGRGGVIGALGFIGLAVVLSAVATGAQGLGRFLRIAVAGDSSSERLVAWRDALGLPLADPVRALLGFGLENQAVAFERAEATVRLTQNQQWDRVHNVFLDTWLTSGIVGVVALVVLLALAARWLLRLRPSLLAAALLAAVVAHVVEVSFAFETVTSATLCWLLLGMAAALAPSTYVAQHRIRWRAAATALAGVLSVALVPLLLAPAIGDAIYGQGRRAVLAGDPRFAASSDEAASAWLPWAEEPIRAAGLAWQQVFVRQADLAASQRALADLQVAAERAPLEPTPQLRLLRLHLAAERLPEAEAACQRAMALGPYRATVWDGCADVAARAGQSDLAQQRRARAEELRQPL